MWSSSYRKQTLQWEREGGTGVPTLYYFYSSIDTIQCPPSLPIVWKRHHLREIAAMHTTLFLRPYLLHLLLSQISKLLLSRQHNLKNIISIRRQATCTVRKAAPPKSDSVSPTWQGIVKRKLEKSARSAPTTFFQLWTRRWIEFQLATCHVEKNNN